MSLYDKVNALPPRSVNTVSSGYGSIQFMSREAALDAIAIADVLARSGMTCGRCVADRLSRRLAWVTDVYEFTAVDGRLTIYNVAEANACARQVCLLANAGDEDSRRRVMFSADGCDDLFLAAMKVVDGDHVRHVNVAHPGVVVGRMEGRQVHDAILIDGAHRLVASRRGGSKLPLVFFTFDEAAAWVVYDGPCRVEAALALYAVFEQKRIGTPPPRPDEIHVYDDAARVFVRTPLGDFVARHGSAPVAKAGGNG